MPFRSCKAGVSQRGGGASAAGRAVSAAVLLLATIVAFFGCQGGVHWQGPTYPDALARARRSNQLTFVYFRSWYLPECTDFEERVLKSSEVLPETRNMVCVVLDFDWDRPLAQQWHLSTVPAFAIVAPGGDVLARQESPITPEELLRAMRVAKAAFGVSTQPSVLSLLKVPW